MRTTHYDRGWIKIDNKVAGINLGHDSCAEHEEGVNHIMRQLGLTSEFGLGLERHRIRNVPAGLTFSISKSKGKGRRDRKVVKIATLAMIDPECSFPSPNIPTPQALWMAVEDEGNYEGINMHAAAWDRDSFAVSVMGSENIENLKKIHEAILAGDACISLSGSFNPFARSGLCLTIASAVPEEVAIKAKLADESNKRLEDAVLASGIRDELKAANRRYYALAPRWTDETETSFTFFLNPQEQHIYNFGWMTLDDLRDWIRGTGKVMKNEFKK